MLAAHAASALGALLGIVPEGSPALAMTTVSGELNLPAWLSTMELVMAAGFAVVLANREPAPSTTRRGWFLLAVILALHAIDEGCAFHERVLETGRFPFGSSYTERWAILGVAAVAVVSAALTPLLRRLQLETRIRLVAAGATYYFGAVVLHLVAAVVEVGGHSTRFLAVSTLEEAAELAGVALLLYTLAREHESAEPVGALSPAA